MVFEKKTGENVKKSIISDKSGN